MLSCIYQTKGGCRHEDSESQSKLLTNNLRPGQKRQTWRSSEQFAAVRTR